MEIFFRILVFYYLMIFIFVGWMGSIVILSMEEVLDSDEILSNPKDFFRCVFMYQIQIKVFLEDCINVAGIVIVEILTTLSVWFLNIGIFAILLFCLMIKGIFYGFWLIFRKRNNDEENYKK